MSRALLWASCMYVKTCSWLPVWLCVQLYSAPIFQSKHSAGSLVSLHPTTTPWPGPKLRNGAVVANRNPGLNAPASWHQRRPSQTGETSETWAHIKAPPSGRRSGEASCSQCLWGFGPLRPYLTSIWKENLRVAWWTDKRPCRMTRYRPLTPICQKKKKKNNRVGASQAVLHSHAGMGG